MGVESSVLHFSAGQGILCCERGFRLPRIVNCEDVPYLCQNSVIRSNRRKHGDFWPSGTDRRGEIASFTADTAHTLLMMAS
jgi:hypothetical protein